MKKLGFLLAMLMLLSSFALAEAPRTPGADKLIDDPVMGVTTTFKKYDAKFYDKESAQPGTIVRLDYTTDVYGETLNQWANVYLPYGYDEAKQYNIIYFLHGTNETQTSFIGDARAKNAMDGIIEAGVTDPFIMVFPCYYYDYETRAIDMNNFVLEVRNDLMPAVESAYSTYAETADEAGFIASREHRAFGGYSRGCYAAWHMFFHNLDYAYWYMPFSANISGPEEMSLGMPVEEQIAMLKEAIDRQAAYKDSFYIYAACGGGRDMMYDVNNALITAMLAETDYFSYGQDKTVNNLYYCQSKEIHQTLISRYYLYNAFDVVFK